MNYAPRRASRHSVRLLILILCGALLLPSLPFFPRFAVSADLVGLRFPLDSRLPNGGNAGMIEPSLLTGDKAEGGETSSPDPGDIVTASAGPHTIGLYDPSQTRFHLRYSNTGGGDNLTFTLNYAGASLKPISGDWNGDGIDTIGLVDTTGVYNPSNNTFFLKNSNSAGSGFADVTFTYGWVGGLVPITGDWDGNGTDTIGLYDPATAAFFLRNSNSGGVADLTFTYGPANLGWVPIAGDWDGNGTDTIGLYDPANASFFLRNSNSGGIADVMFTYGWVGGPVPLAGDWDGDGDETIGLYNPPTAAFFLRNTNDGGIADLMFNYAGAASSWKPITGHWGSQPPPSANYSEARVDPYNRTGLPGEDLLSRNFNWSLPLVGLPGRAGLDLGLSLTYNSLVWTKSGTGIKFNADNGYPAPGFRLGFPVIQAKYLNTQVGGVNAYLLITPSGYRVELRQVGTSNIYESADSSYIQMVENNGGASLLLLTPDGSKMDYTPYAGEYRCTKITDRNGNYIEATYHSDGRLHQITDTLGRIVTFNYNPNLTLDKITQDWDGQSHTWASFSYTLKSLAPNFSGLSVDAPSSFNALTQVTLADGSRFTFEYSNVWGQVLRVNQYAQDNHLLNYIRYNLPTSATLYTDCPHFTERWDWAENWNGGNEVPTFFSFDTAGRSWGQATAPDQTTYKELFYTSGYQRGLVLESQVIAGGQTKKRTTLDWTQDDIGLSYRKNPRVIETNVYDDEVGNRRRTMVTYTSTFGLPSDVREYAANGTTVLRRTHTDYNLSSTYIVSGTRRIVGLATARFLYEGENGALASRVEYAYDLSAQLENQPNATRHDDGNYGIGFLARGNLCRVRRYEVPTANFVESFVGYKTTGNVAYSRDPLNHQTSISYTDDFADGIPRNTFAYPTTMTDAGGFASTTRYHFDRGVVTRSQDPKGAVVTYLYEAMAGRLAQVTNGFTGAYTEFDYPTNHTRVNTYTTVIAGQGEAQSFQELDGAGRVRYAASEFPGSTGGYRATHTIYDVMGRVSQQSNPTETSGPGNWAATGGDAWVYTQQTYDWQGRPTETKHLTDNTTRTLDYSGCGCAGGAVVTSTDEVGRKQKLYHDVLGRAVKSEVLNLNGTVYSSSVTTYNVRDQATLVREYPGAEGSTPFQDTVMTYDGHGRLWKRRLPIESGDTIYLYNADDTVQKRTDARGASQTFAYNSRHLVTSITHAKPPGQESLPESGPLAIHKGTDTTFDYDAAGNRLWMEERQQGIVIGRTDYVYDTISRLDQETRTISGLGAFLLDYSYTLGGQLASLSDPFNGVVTYGYNKVGELTSVTGNSGGFHGVTNFASNFQYRAFGGIKSVLYGNGKSVTLGYDTRLRLTSYSGVSSLDSETYQYYADSRLERVLRPALPQFERSYQYDHAGRLRDAKTGRAARGQGELEGDPDPYKQVYEYDAFSNMTSRTNRFWNHDADGFAADYTNNRNDAWGYDEAGNVKNDDSNAQVTYNTASQMTEWERQGDLKITQIYDGDGLPAKRVEERTSPTFNSVIHYLRSSALGGAVIAEMNASGQVQGAGQYRYVYANGGVLAREEYNALTQSYVMRWQHINPATGDRVESAAGGGVISNKPLDPLGGLVGQGSPYLTDPTPSYEEMVGTGRPMFMEDANPFSAGVGCTLDGMPVDCNRVFQMAGNGTAEVARSTVRQTTSGHLAMWNPNAGKYWVGSNANNVYDYPNDYTIRVTSQHGYWVDDDDPEYDIANALAGKGHLHMFGFGVGTLTSEQDDPEMWSRMIEAHKKPPTKGPCDPSRFSEHEAAFRRIAQVVGGVYRQSHPGYADSKALVVNTRISAREAFGKFAPLDLPDPHWDHWGGEDRKVKISGTWYHLTVFFNYTPRRIRSGNIRGERWDMFTHDRDHNLPPSRIEIHCEPEEPGTWWHTLQFLNRKLGGGQ